MRRPGGGRPTLPPDGQSRPSVEGQLVYAIGDVHGCYELMKQLLGEITRDCLEQARDRLPILIFCGDYIDRGPESAKVLEALIWLRGRTDFDLRLLKGNHEQALLEFLDRPEEGADWMSFGGAETLASYGVAPPSEEDPPEAYVRARDQLLARMPAGHLRLLERLEMMVIVGDYVFVHAGVRPGTRLAEQRAEDLLWIREEFIHHPGSFEKIVVHGHTWRDEAPQILEQRVGIDTGAYATGVLTAVRLQDGGLSILQARGAPSAAEPSPV